VNDGRAGWAEAHRISLWRKGDAASFIVALKSSDEPVASCWDACNRWFVSKFVQCNRLKDGEVKVSPALTGF
jgi:hypothetical protein